jgi:hypothetical protein
MERYGLRVSLLAGFATQVVMITLSVTGVHLAEPHVAYAVVWVGQARALRRGQRQRPCGRVQRKTDAQATDARAAAGCGLFRAAVVS